MAVAEVAIPLPALWRDNQPRWPGLGLTSPIAAPPAGLLLAFLPCGLPIWALSLAAVTGSWWQGGLFMVLFTLITSIPLLAFVLTPALAPRAPARWRALLPAVMLLLSGIWLGLIAGAALDWIPHGKFQLFGVHWRLW